MTRRGRLLVLALLFGAVGCTLDLGRLHGTGIDSGPRDAPGLDAPGLDAPSLDAPGLDAPGLDAPGLDGPGLDAPADLRDVGPPGPVELVRRASFLVSAASLDAIGAEPMHGNKLVIYTSPAEAGAPAWTRAVLDESLVDGHALACGDLAGLGRDQIVVGWRAMNKPGVKVGLKLFTPLDADGRQWSQTLVDDNTMACEDLCLADLNNDGRLDIVAAGRATKNLKIYFNQGAGSAK